MPALDQTGDNPGNVYGGVTVFADIVPETFCIDPARVRDRLSASYLLALAASIGVLLAGRVQLPWWRLAAGGAVVSSAAGVSPSGTGTERVTVSEWPRKSTLGPNPRVRAGKLTSPVPASDGAGYSCAEAVKGFAHNMIDAKRVAGILRRRLGPERRKVTRPTYSE